MEHVRSAGPRDERERRGDDRFEVLIESITDYAIFLLDPDGYVRTWNRGAERLKGYRPQEIIGRHFREFYDADAQARHHPEQVLDVAARDGRYEEEGWRVRKGGSRFWAGVLITALRDVRGNLIGFGKVTHDLTARRLAEEQLRLRATELRTANGELELFRRLVTSVADYAIFMLDAGGYITTWNAGAEQIKGFSADQAIGRHFSIFYTAEDRLRHHPAHELEIAAREGRYEEERWRLRRDGSRFWANVVITAIRNDRGILTGFAKVTRDLTARRAAEQQLRRAKDQLEDSNAELRRFSTVAAHDLREPLGMVGALAETLGRREGDRLTDSGRELLGNIGDAVVRMQDLIGDLLTYARLDPEDHALVAAGLRISMDGVLRRLSGSVAERGATVDVALPDEAEVLAARAAVDLLLGNLVSNALKFGDPAGPHVRVSAERARGGWLVTVADDGAGIADEDRDRIFGAFQRLPGASRVPGTGLGLAICRRAVERSGGEIGVASSPGEGSRFWFWLRAAPARRSDRS